MKPEWLSESERRMRDCGVVLCGDDVRSMTLWQRQRDSGNIERSECVAVMYILHRVISLLHARNTGRQDVSVESYYDCALQV